MSRPPHALSSRLGRALVGAVAVLGVLAGPAMTPASAQQPHLVRDPFPFTGPDFENRLVIFLNTTRELFCIPEQIAFEQAVDNWLDDGMVGPPPEPTAQPGATGTLGAWVNETPMGTHVTTRGWQSGLHMELWVMDDPEDAATVGACLDTDDAAQLFASGDTSSFRAQATDFDYLAASDPSIARPWALDSSDGRGRVSTPAGEEYVYSWSFHQHVPCEGSPDPVCEVFQSSLRPVG
jgi:hypothetical protein